MTTAPEVGRGLIGQAAVGPNVVVLVFPMIQGALSVFEIDEPML